jgi:hypothetical protein
VRGKDKGVIDVDITTGDRGNLNAIRKAVILHKIDKNLKKVGIEAENIVNTKRDRKKKEILDL